MLGTSDTGQDWRDDRGTWGILDGRAYVQTPLVGDNIATIPGAATPHGGPVLEGETGRNGDLICEFPVTTDNQAVVWRYTNASNFWTLVAAPGFTTYAIFHRVNGDSTWIGDLGSFLPANGDRVRVVFDADELTIYARRADDSGWGSALFTDTELAYTGLEGTRVGIADYLGTNSIGRWDNFTFTASVDPEPPEPPEPEEPEEPEEPPEPTGYPDATNTGVPVGTTLTIHNGDFTTSSTSQVVEELDIRGRLIILHNNVTVRKCRLWGDGGLTGNGIFAVFRDWTANATGLLIEDCDIGKSGPNTHDVGVVLGPNTIRRCHIHNCSDAIQANGGATIQRNYITGLRAKDGQAHLDGVQMFSGSGRTLIEDNWIDCKQNAPYSIGANGAVFFQGSFGNIDVWGNVLLGSGYLLRIETGANGVNQILNNRFQLTQEPRFGPWSLEVPTTRSGNVWHDTGAPIT